MRVALLYPTTQHGTQLRDALNDLGAAVVYETAAANIDRDALENSGARTVVVNLGSDSDDYIDQLYDDQFIETCAPWVIFYIADLIGYQSVKGIAPVISNPRSEVADTISLRRRKGTVLVMEQLARDVTGWGAHAVEFFRVLGDTQYMNHLRLRNHYSPDLRCWKTGVYIDTGFDRTAHKVDVRRMAAHRGRYKVVVELLEIGLGQ